VNISVLNVTAVQPAYGSGVSNAVGAWSTGKMTTSHAYWGYVGPDLQPETVYAFTVEWWDEIGTRATPSEQGLFETGACISTPTSAQTTACKVGKSGTSGFNASWIGVGNMTLAGVRLRSEFSLPHGLTIARARAYFSGQGWGDLYINCARVDPMARLNPAWSHPFLYSTFDVTAMVKPGARNAVAVELGHGKSAKFSGENPFTAPPELQKVGLAALLRLRVDLSDGSTVVLSSQSDGWRVSSSGPYTSQDIDNGVNYDARREQPGWCDAGYDQAGWATPIDLSASGAAPPGIARSLSVVTSQFFQLIRDIAVLQPVETVRFVNAPRVVVVHDFGTNVPGVVVLTDVAGPLGTTVGVRTGEIINCTPGRVSFVSNTGAMAWDNYKIGTPNSSFAATSLEGTTTSPTVATTSIRGGAAAIVNSSITSLVTAINVASITHNTTTFSPRFTYHGFRFAEVYTSHPGAVVGGAEAHVATSSVPVIGSFVASPSAPLLTQYYNATMLSLRGHLMGFPEDCAVRSERQPWGADMALVASAAAINFDLRAFYSNTLREINSGVMYIGTGSPLWGLGHYFIAIAVQAQYGDSQNGARQSVDGFTSTQVLVVGGTVTRTAQDTTARLR
jgi:alpha-L-rhamnosidase